MSHGNKIYFTIKSFFEILIFKFVVDEGCLPLVWYEDEDDRDQIQFFLF
jgi:hypothetical protein